MLLAPTREREDAQKGNYSQALRSLRLGFDGVWMPHSLQQGLELGGGRAVATLVATTTREAQSLRLNLLENIHYNNVKRKPCGVQTIATLLWSW